jgi:glycosyltransferase involved in cell wall biosynthesis
MSKPVPPAITVLTPVYNGERYLRECIESVRGQTRTDWEYIVVDNRSTDSSASIAEQYAAADERIRVIRAEEFVNVHRNFSRCARLMSPESRFCQFLSADDWLFPECLERTMSLAEKYPEIGIVSAYRLEGRGLRHGGWLDYSQQLVSGKEVVRRQLLGQAYVTGSLSSVLLRADLVRSVDPFLDETVWHSDVDAMFRILVQSDLGFVHQITNYTRLHEGALTASFSQRINTYTPLELRMLIRYGRRVLSPEEYWRTMRHSLYLYARFFAREILRPARWRDARFHVFHREEIARLLAEMDGDREARIVLKSLRLLLRDLRSSEISSGAFVRPSGARSGGT